jgi:nucleoid DNA-binding protein/nucleoid-associated protein YgaU
MSEKITFRELVELIAEQSKQSQSSTNSFISELVQLIESGLRQSGTVTISGFGKFELRWMKERPGVNPQTGEEITIPGQNKVVFKPYKALRGSVNRPYAKMEAKVLEPETSHEDAGDDADAQPGPEKDSKEKKAAAPISLSPETDTGDEEVDDLLIERPVPERKEPIPKFEDLKRERVDEDTIAALFSKPAEDEPKKTVPVSTATPKKPGRAAVKEVQRKGTMNWTWAAAAFLVIAAIIIIIFLMRPADDTADVIADEPTEQLTAPADQALRATPEPAEPDPQPEPDPGEDIPSDITPFDIEPVTVQQGQSLWSIAEVNMGNPYFWPVIFDLNREILDNPNLVPVFAELSVPAIQDPENLTPEQLELVAMGYLSVYEWMAENSPEDARYFLWAVGVFSAEILAQAENHVNQEDWNFANTR